MAGIYYFNQNPVLRTAVDIMTVLDRPRGINFFLNVDNYIIPFNIGL